MSEVSFELVHPDTLDVVHIFSGEEVVTGGADGQIWIATFASIADAEAFIRDARRQGRSLIGTRRVTSKSAQVQP